MNACGGSFTFYRYRVGVMSGLNGMRYQGDQQGIRLLSQALVDFHHVKGDEICSPFAECPKHEQHPLVIERALLAPRDII